MVFSTLVSSLANTCPAAFPERGVVVDRIGC